MSTSKTLRIGRNRTLARIWIEGAALAANGWNKGDKFNAEFSNGSITYTRAEDGARIVAGSETRPVIDTNTNKILSSFGDDATHVRVVITKDSVKITRASAPLFGGVVAATVATVAAIAAPYISQFRPGALRVLVACEESATVRDAFSALGHDAVSCDVMDTRNPEGWHIKGDVRPYLKGEWNLVIGFPPCTFRVNSAAWAFADPDFNRFPGVGYHQKVSPETLTGAARRAAREDAIAFMREIWDSCHHVALENPVGHPIWQAPTQIIQPFQFGHPESKQTCLWLKNLPALTATNVLKIEEHGKHTPKGWRWLNQTVSGQSNLGPSADRAKIRSKTFQGIGEAMADQWSRYLMA